MTPTDDAVSQLLGTDAELVASAIRDREAEIRRELSLATARLEAVARKVHTDLRSVAAGWPARMAALESDLSGWNTKVQGLESDLQAARKAIDEERERHKETQSQLQVLTAAQGRGNDSTTATLRRAEQAEARLTEVRAQLLQSEANKDEFKSVLYQFKAQSEELAEECARLRASSAAPGTRAALPTGRLVRCTLSLPVLLESVVISGMPFDELNPEYVGECYQSGDWVFLFPSDDQPEWTEDDAIPGPLTLVEADQFAADHPQPAGLLDLGGTLSGGGSASDWLQATCGLQVSDRRPTGSFWFYDAPVGEPGTRTEALEQAADELRANGYLLKPASHKTLGEAYYFQPRSPDPTG